MTDFRRFQELAEIAVACLEEVAIDYVLVGGATVGVYGVIRSTEDIDLMLKLGSRDKAKIKALVACFQKNHLSITVTELTKGLVENSHITVFDLKNPIIRLDLKQIRTQVDHSTFDLRREVDLFGSGKTFWVSSPESLIVVKLLPGFQSEKDLDDVQGILLRSSNIIDWSLLEKLTVDFGSDKLLAQLKAELKLE